MTITLIAVAISMLARDGLAVLLVVAEARGRALLAGTLDALYDLAQIVSYVIGAGEIVIHGWNAKAAAIIATMMAASLAGTTLFTVLSRRIKEQPA